MTGAVSAKHQTFDFDVSVSLTDFWPKEIDRSVSWNKLLIMKKILLPPLLFC